MYEVGTHVRYHGSIYALHGDGYVITGYCHDGKRYNLGGRDEIRHVRPWHVTAMDELDRGVAMAIVVDERGQFDLDEIALPEGRTLMTMRQVIGCTRLDVVRLTTHLDMWVNDEGLYEAPVNPAATALARRYGQVRQPYHGTVVLTDHDDQGNTINLAPHRVRALLVALDDITNPAA